MIKTVPVSHEAILAAIPVGEPVGILGCGECAAALGTGGTRQVDAWEKLFHDRNELTFKAVADAPCDQRLLKRFLAMLPGFSKTRFLLLLTCPAGTQSLAGLLPELVNPPRLIQGLSAQGLVWLSPGGKTTTGCRFCGDCHFDPSRDTFCPTASCPLQKLDGPCQTREQGHLCPLNPGQHCTWLTPVDNKSDAPSPGDHPSAKDRTRA